MSKQKITCQVVSSEVLAPDVYSLWLEMPAIAKEAVPGQFVSLYCNNGDRLLPRPISICEIDREKGQLHFVYRVVGAGTTEFSKLQKGDSLAAMGPLGNGFVLEGENPILIGGGIGVPPMLELAKQFAGKATVVLGYRDSKLFLKEEFDKVAKVVIATDDGSVGTKGTVLDAIRENAIIGDRIYSCGPLPMLRGVKEFGLEKDIITYLSMEEKMACGIGACLACVCKSTGVDHHSKVNNKRVCKEGPVFLSTEVEL